MNSREVTPKPAASWALCLALSAAVVGPLPALAQGAVYRIVGADGKVTYADKLPSDSAVKGGPAARSASGLGGISASSGASSSSALNTLPFELRQAALKYPVTLYTSENCGPCGAGRSMLTSRGIPFNEKTVNTGEDIQALQRLMPEPSLPLLTIGSRQLRGFVDSEWTQYLDAAGYPSSSALPARYRAQAPSPMAPANVVVAPQPADAALRGPPPIAPTAQPYSPPGIRF